MYRVSRPLLGYLDAEGLAQIERAERFVHEAHQGQVRAEGVPYTTHLIAVAELAAFWGCDVETIMAALLHDVVEDTPVTLQEVSQEFGETVAKLVDGATKVESPDRILADEQTRQKILAYTQQDSRVAYVKLADRVHNLSTISFLSEERRQRIVKESVDFYVPLAASLGDEAVISALDEVLVTLNSR
ncbi:hypothetical protein BH11PAT4_BH11PAT4_2000 [soil metagenome]